MANFDISFGFVVSQEMMSMSMCLVLEWLMGLLANFMALSLSHKSGILVK